MQLHCYTLAVLAAAIGLQAAPSQQQKVSMTVTSAIGTVGYESEPFQCLPNQTLAALNETLMVQVFGTPGMPYILFTGSPSTYCQPIGGFLGEIAVGAPLLTFRIASLQPDPTGTHELGVDLIKYPVPAYLPIGIQFRLQVLSVAGEGPGFSRATEVHTR